MPPGSGQPYPAAGGADPARSWTGAPALKVLFATTVLPLDPSTGGEVASHAFVEAIRAAGHRVTVIGYRRPGSEPAGDPDTIEVGARPIESDAAGPRAGLWLLSALAGRRPYSVAKYPGRRYRRRLRRAMGAPTPDRVVVDHAQMAWVLDELPAGVPVALLAHNVEHRLYAAAAARARGVVGWLNRREARLMQRLERGAAERADRVWSLSREDAAAFEAHAPSRALDLPVAAAASGDGRVGGGVGLLGTWSWAANAASLDWFVDEVLPLLPAELAVTIAGAGAESWRARAPERVDFAGRVDDAGAVLASCGAIAVPSVAGEGVQVKTLDAIASGRPVVATPIALRGIDEWPETVAVAGEPEQFAAMLVEAADGLAEPAAEAAARWTERRRERFRQAVGEEVGALAAGRRRSAYIASRYPYVSHTFIRREVEALRERGFEVATVTVRRPERREVISAADRAEAERTFAIRPVGAAALIGAHRRALRAGSRAYLATLRFALRGSPGGARALLWQVFYFAQAVRLWDHLRRIGVAHLHVHHANVAADLAMIAAALSDGLDRPLRWSMTVHGPTDLEQPEAHNLALKVERADAVIAISEYARERLQALAPAAGPIRVIHCGVDPDRFDLSREPRSGAALRVLTVARLERRKGVDQLLEALAAVRRDGLDARLSVVGDGPERERLERLSATLGLTPAVEFAGAVAGEQVAGHYRDADVFCLPSHAEGVPIVLMEAMAARLPVIATRIAGIPELISDGESGLLVPPGDPGALATALARVSDRDLADRLGESGRRAVLDGFTIAESADRISVLFAAELDPGGGGAVP